MSSCGFCVLGEVDGSSGDCDVPVGFVVPGLAFGVPSCEAGISGDFFTS